jgi:glycosyltransferase involved in cell wall biosynthesis
MPDNPNGMPAQGIPALALPVDVVVPVFNAYQVTRRCIESVLASRPNNGNTPFELVIVDDASTEPELVRYLDDLAASRRATLVRNVSNRGFVHSANCGLGLHPERDVLLLNSDTEVANDWLDRIRACAYREADVGTVTPFSNNATICSYPVFCADNPLSEGMTPASTFRHRVSAPLRYLGTISYGIYLWH